MSRNNIIKENNKKLFESRLQMKPKSGMKATQTSFENKTFNDNFSLVNNSQNFAKIMIQKQLKNHSTIENSFLNNINNSTINKKIIKINKKNRLNTKYLNINLSQNKSNIFIKDITFFHLKKSPKNKDTQNKTINVNKRITKLNSKNNSVKRNTNIKNSQNRLAAITLNIKKFKKSKRNQNLINSIKRSMTSINETNNIIINNSNYIMNNTNININNINNKIIFKNKFVQKEKITNDNMFIKLPNYPYRTNLNSKRNDSNPKKNINRHNSLLMNKIQKLQKFKIEKKQNIIKNKNFNYRLNGLIFSSNLNQKGRNSINLLKNDINVNNKKTIDISKGFTQRSLFMGKIVRKSIQKGNNNSVKFSKNNSKNKKQNNTLNFDISVKNENDFNSNRNLNIHENNLSNKFLTKEKDNKKNFSRNSKNNFINKSTYNKQIFVQKLNTINKSNKTLVNKDKKLHPEELYILDIKNNLNQNHNKKIEFKDIDKTEQVIEDILDINKENLNDDFFSTEKDNKINDTSKEEDSGILSMDEVKDIIIYHDMKDVRKKDNFLFNYNDHNEFVQKNGEKLKEIFFDNRDNYDINQYKMKSGKKYISLKYQNFE